MATITAYPTPSESGPLINRLERHPIDYPVTRYEFEDGGVEVNIAPCGLQRWDVYHEGLTPAELQTLVDHWNEAKGKTNDFSFYDHQQDATFTGVSYADFQIDQHRHKQTLFAHATLVVFV